MASVPCLTISTCFSFANRASFLPGALGRRVSTTPKHKHHQSDPDRGPIEEILAGVPCGVALTAWTGHLHGPRLRVGYPWNVTSHAADMQ